MNRQYTGRKIAIFTDVHGLFEPLEAVLLDIRNRGINEIYSLGDNIGVGPSPSEVIDMLEYYDVKTVAGNAEEYCNLGVAPFLYSFDSDKLKNYFWTKYTLGERRLEYIKNLPHSFDLEVGGKKIALCHFANDVRIDYGLYGSEKYLYNFARGEGYKQFLFTNSPEQKEAIIYNIQKFGVNRNSINGFLSARDYPIFDGKMVTYYDSIIQGHIHRNMYEFGAGVEFNTIRAMAVHFDDDPIDLAFYIILHEKVNGMGFDIERVYVPFDRKKMEYTIISSDEPTGKIRKLVYMN